MKILQKIYRYASLTLSMFVLVACADDDESVNRLTIDETLRGYFVNPTNKLSNVSVFYAAAEKAGLADQLDDEAADFTYFVPTNDAMQKLLEANGVKNVEAAPAELLDSLLQNHIVEGTVLSSALSKTSVTTVNEQTIYVSVANGVVLNSDATVTDADNEGTNGVIHVIDQPLIDFPSMSIAGIVSAAAADADAPEFTTLLAALEATGLDETLAGGDWFSVFAPTDAAFADLGLNASNIASSFTNEELTEILSYHVLAGRNFSLDIPSGRYYTIVGGPDSVQGFDLDVAADAVEIDLGINNHASSAEVTSLNVLATNGTVHVVDAVIFVEPDIIEAMTGNYSGMAAACGGQCDPFFLPELRTDFLNATDMNFDSLLTREEVFTVIVPGSYASGGLSEPALSETLMKYVFEGSIDVSASAGGAITSIGGDRYYLNQDPDGVTYFNGREPVYYFSGSGLGEDIPVYNGTITVTNSADITALPETSTTTEMSSDGDVSLFVGALEFLELDSLEDVTYLYLENADFQSVLEDAYEENEVDFSGFSTQDFIDNLDEADEATFSSVVNRHIVTDVFFSLELEAGLSFTNRRSETIEIVDVGGTLGILVNEDGNIFTIGFDSTDILGSNGVVHIIDAEIPAP